MDSSLLALSDGIFKSDLLALCACVVLSSSGSQCGYRDSPFFLLLSLLFELVANRKKGKKPKAQK